MQLLVYIYKTQTANTALFFIDGVRIGSYEFKQWSNHILLQDTLVKKQGFVYNGAELKRELSAPALLEFYHALTNKSDNQELHAIEIALLRSLRQAFINGIERMIHAPSNKPEGAAV